MPLWLIGVIGVGAYLLLTKNSSATSSNVASAQAASNAAMAQAIAANPSGLQPGFQGQVQAQPPNIPPYDPGLGSVQQGGQVFDPNLGGVPTLSSIQQSIQQYGADPGLGQAFDPTSTTTASGVVGHHSGTVGHHSRR